MKTAIFVEPEICTVRQLLAVAGTAEANSEHPIASAITTYAKEVRDIWSVCWVDNITERCLGRQYMPSVWVVDFCPSSFHVAFK